MCLADNAQAVARHTPAPVILAQDGIFRSAGRDVTFFRSRMVDHVCASCDERRASAPMLSSHREAALTPPHGGYGAGILYDLRGYSPYAFVSGYLPLV